MRTTQVSIDTQFVKRCRSLGILEQHHYLVGKTNFDCSMKLKSGILPTNSMIPLDAVDSLDDGRFGIGAIPLTVNSGLPGASFLFDFGDVTLNGIASPGPEGKWIGKRSGMWDLVTEPRVPSCRFRVISSSDNGRPPTGEPNW